MDGDGTAAPGGGAHQPLLYINQLVPSSLALGGGLRLEQQAQRVLRHVQVQPRAERHGAVGARLRHAAAEGTRDAF